MFSFLPYPVPTLLSKTTCDSQELFAFMRIDCNVTFGGMLAITAELSAESFSVPWIRETKYEQSCLSVSSDCFSSGSFALTSFAMVSATKAFNFFPEEFDCLNFPLDL